MGYAVFIVVCLLIWMLIAARFPRRCKRCGGRVFTEYDASSKHNLARCSACDDCEDLGEASQDG